MDTDSIFEIRDTDIDVDDIRERLKLSLEKRMRSDNYPPDPESIENLNLKNDNKKNLSNQNIERDFDNINSFWDIHNNNYVIRSHHPFIGKILVRGREMVNGEVRRYIDPILTRQTEFNASTARILNENTKQIALLHNEHQLHSVWEKQQEQKIDMSLDRVRKEIEQTLSNIKQEVNDRISGDIENKKEMLKSFTERLITQKFYEILVGLESDFRTKTWQEKAHDGQIANSRTEFQNDSPNKHQSEEYFLFNEIIGKAWITESGDLVAIPNVFEDTSILFASCNNVLDIGCGQGFFLSLLKSRNIGSYGIDINPIFVTHCLNHDLKVFTVDAITHLESLDDETLDGIFISQLVEHLNPDSIFSLIALCYKKLKKSSYMVISTPNILSVQVSSSLFYMDPSHKTHLHPEVLKYFIKVSGFSEITEKFYNPVPDDHKLKMIDENLTENSHQLFHIFNYNIGFLNQFLFGSRDYAIIAKK